MSRTRRTFEALMRPESFLPGWSELVQHHEGWFRRWSGGSFFGIIPSGELPELNFRCAESAPLRTRDTECQDWARWRNSLAEQRQKPHWISAQPRQTARRLMRSPPS